jgi:hypothetical protein
VGETPVHAVTVLRGIQENVRAHTDARRATGHRVCHPIIATSYHLGLLTFLRVCVFGWERLQLHQ